MAGEHQGLQRLELAQRTLREVLLVGFGYFVYSQIRAISADHTVRAVENAYWIMDFEERLGVFKELALQAWVLPRGPLVDFFNFVYFYAFFPLLIPLAVWLFLKRPGAYRLLRNAFFVSGAIGAVLFVLVPTAPPRMLGIGIIDTLEGTFAPTGDSIPGVNRFAALPSMHVGWTFLTALGIYIALDGKKFRGVVWLLPILMMTATVTTGNHYFVDGVLGIIVALVGLAVALALDRRRSPRRDRLQRSTAARSRQVRLLPSGHHG